MQRLKGHIQRLKGHMQRLKGHMHCLKGHIQRLKGHMQRLKGHIQCVKKGMCEDTQQNTLIYTIVFLMFDLMMHSAHFYITFQM